MTSREQRLRGAAQQGLPEARVSCNLWRVERSGACLAIAARTSVREEIFRDALKGGGVLARQKRSCNTAHCDPRKGGS